MSVIDLSLSLSLSLSLYPDHYSLEHAEMYEPVDCSYLRDDRPQRTSFGGELLPGFKIALASMRAKESADFLIEPQYAFGELGCEPRIPKNSTGK